MAVKKRKSTAKHKTVKHKKTTVRKHRVNTAVEKDAAVEMDQPQEKDAQENVVSSEPQVPIVSTEPTTSIGSANSLGSPVVASSRTSQESTKEQVAQAEPKSSDPTQLESQWQTLQSNQTQPQSQPQSQSQEQQPASQLSEQSIDDLPSQTDPAVSAPSTETSQDSSSFSGVIREKPEEDTELQNIDEPKKKRLWIVIAIITIVLVLAGGALWYFRENVMKRASVKDEIIPTPSILKNTPIPASDSAQLEIDYSKYKINVLNGSGIGGVAGSTRDLLEGEEFVVEDVGNADSSDYENTVIQAKEGVPDEFLDKLKSVLEESYVLDPNEELEDSEDVDIVIIIGSSKQP